MTKNISGAVGYKRININNKKYITLFSDIHDNTDYCNQTNTIYIDNFLKNKIINNPSNTLVLIEEVEQRNNKLEFLWKGIKHSEALYLLIQKDINCIIPVEIRHLLIPYSLEYEENEIIKDDYFDIIKYIFDDENKINTLKEDILNIKDKLNYKYVDSNEHSEKLGKIFINIKKKYTNLINSKKIKSNFEIIKKIDNMLSEILEYYVIKLILNTKRRHIYAKNPIHI